MGLGSEQGRLPQPAPGAREKLYTICILASLSGAVAGIGDWWLHPRGLGLVMLILASVLIGIATGLASFAIPVPRQPGPWGCPCCGQQITPAAPDDGAFCWDCGLYANDDPAGCDNEDHHR